MTPQRLHADFEWRISCCSLQRRTKDVFKKGRNLPEEFGIECGEAKLYGPEDRPKLPEILCQAQFLLEIYKEYWLMASA